MILEQFYPKEWVESTYEIDFEAWRDKGIRGVIFDIDNTLVCHDAPADERAIGLFARLRELGMAVCLISNNKLPRVEPFAGAVGAQFIENAHKPGVKSYQKAMDLMGCTKENALFVGDQLFTDVYGAKRAGMHAVLVKPIHPKEEIQIVLKRYLEKVVLYFYEKQRNSEK